MHIGAQNRREISRVLHNHRCTDITTCIAVNVPAVLKQNFHIPFSQIQSILKLGGWGYVAVFFKKDLQYGK